MPKEAKMVVLKSAKPMSFSPGFSEFVKKKVLGKSMKKGDSLSIEVIGGTASFTVADTMPSGNIVVDTDTELDIEGLTQKQKSALSLDYLKGAAYACLVFGLLSILLASAMEAKFAGAFALLLGIMLLFLRSQIKTS